MKHNFSHLKRSSVKNYPTELLKDINASSTDEFKKNHDTVLP